MRIIYFRYIEWIWGVNLYYLRQKFPQSARYKKSQMHICVYLYIGWNFCFISLLHNYVHYYTLHSLTFIRVHHIHFFFLFKYNKWIKKTLVVTICLNHNARCKYDILSLKLLLTWLYGLHTHKNIHLYSLRILHELLHE